MVEMFTSSAKIEGSNPDDDEDDETFFGESTVAVLSLIIRAADMTGGCWFVGINVGQIVFQWVCMVLFVSANDYYR